MLRFLDLANAITLTGLISSLGCALLASSGYLAAAIVALVVSGLCDFFDGFVARKMKRTAEEKTFGARLDSLVDACSFGLAPAVLLYFSGNRGILGAIIVAIFTISCVWRLAYFETVGMAGKDGRHYVGLPCTYVALVLPLALLSGFHSTEAMKVAGMIATPLLSLAMVSKIPFPKPGGIWYPILTLLALGTIAVYAVAGDHFPGRSL